MTEWRPIRAPGRAHPAFKTQAELHTPEGQDEKRICILAKPDQGDRGPVFALDPPPRTEGRIIHETECRGGQTCSLVGRRSLNRQCILVLTGAISERKKELIAMDDGHRESEQSWKELLLDGPDPKAWWPDPGRDEEAAEPLVFVGQQ